MQPRDTVKRDFDKEASAWDMQAQRVALARDVAAAMLAAVSPHTGMRVLDFGCGTGLLTLALAPLVGSVVGVDSSPGMLAALEAKIEALPNANVTAQTVDLERGDALPGGMDLIVSSMTLHHVADVPALLTRFRAALVPGGALCVADLETEDGSFHADPAGVYHHGFDREALSQAFQSAGFQDVLTSRAAAVRKPDATGTLRDYGVLLVHGRRG